MILQFSARNELNEWTAESSLNSLNAKLKKQNY